MSRISVSTSTSESVESIFSENCDDEKISMENFALLKVLGKGGFLIYFISFFIFWFIIFNSFLNLF